MPQAEADWQVFNLDYVENAFVQILTGFEIKAYPKRSTQKLSTPCVELHLETSGVQGQRFLRFPALNTDLVQPYNVWNYNLQTTIKTERDENGSQHGKLCGQVRAYFSYYWLTLTFTETVSPYHSITEIREADASHEYNPDDNTDISQINFSGMLNIRNTAWPTFNP